MKGAPQQRVQSFCSLHRWWKEMFRPEGKNLPQKPDHGYGEKEQSNVHSEEEPECGCMQV